MGRETDNGDSICRLVFLGLGYCFTLFTPAAGELLRTLLVKCLERAFLVLLVFLLLLFASQMDLSKWICLEFGGVNLNLWPLPYSHHPEFWYRNDLVILNLFIKFFLKYRVGAGSEFHVSPWAWGNGIPCPCWKGMKSTDFVPSMGTGIFICPYFPILLQVDSCIGIHSWPLSAPLTHLSPKEDCIFWLRHREEGHHEHTHTLTLSSLLFFEPLCLLYVPTPLSFHMVSTPSVG